MKIEKLYNRNDGSVVKVVAELCVTPTGIQSISNYVLSKQNTSTNWVLHTNSIIPRVFNGVNDYLANGRPHMLRVATAGEILKANQELLMAAH
jgi:hypothetical protein